MSLEKLPTNEPEQYDPNLEAQDEDVVSGGNNRLMYILAAVLLVFVLGYVAMPKGQGSGISSVTPSFMLNDAAVTATAPTGADSIAAGLKTAPAAVKAAEGDEPKATIKIVPATTTTRPPAAMETPAPVVAAVVASPVAVAAAAPEPAPIAAPAAAEPAAPASVTLSGKIEDENGHPLVGATVLLKGSSKGTSTDANGNYSFEVPNGNENILVYGYGGYTDEEVRGSSNKAVNVTLTPRPKTGRRRR